MAIKIAPVSGPMSSMNQNISRSIAPQSLYNSTMSTGTASTPTPLVTPRPIAAAPKPASDMITGYDAQGNPVQVPRGKYVPGISLTPPQQNPGGAALVVPGSGASIGVQQDDPITKFNLALMDMLKTAQGAAGQEDMFKRQTALQRLSVDRLSAMTPENMRFLSPSQQDQVRGGSVKALEPEIDAISASIKAQDSRLQNFERILGTVKDIGNDMVKVNPTPEILSSYRNMILAGGSPGSIPAEIRDKVVAGLSEADWMQYAEATRSRVVTDPTTGLPYWGNAALNSSAPVLGGGTTDGGQSQFRTDRHNNPIAAAVTMGGKNQFTNALDAAGIQWTYGDPFPDDANMRTIKVLGDGREAARAILSRSNAIQGWYLTSTGAQVLPQFGVRTNEDFARLSRDKQDLVIDGIYKAEGGSGILSQNSGARVQKVLSTILNSPNYTQTDRQRLMREFDASSPTVNQELFDLALRSFPVAQQDKLGGQLDTLAFINTVQPALTAYIRAGGNTNVLVGSVDQILGKLGAARSPQAAYLAGQIQQAQQTYRRAMTGVAFSPQESAEYYKLFPSLGNLDFRNQSLLNSLKDSTNRQLQTTLSSRVGGTQNFSEFIKPAITEYTAPYTTDSTNQLFGMSSNTNQSSSNQSYVGAPRPPISSFFR